MRASQKNKASDYWPFVRESTGDRWFPLTKGPVIRWVFPRHDVIMKHVQIQCIQNIHDKQQTWTRLWTHKRYPVPYNIKTMVEWAPLTHFGRDVYIHPILFSYFEQYFLTHLDTFLIYTVSNMRKRCSYIKLFLHKFILYHFSIFVSGVYDEPSSGSRHHEPLAFTNID